MCTNNQKSAIYYTYMLRQYYMEQSNLSGVYKQEDVIKRYKRFLSQYNNDYQLGIHNNPIPFHDSDFVKWLKETEINAIYLAKYLRENNIVTSKDSFCEITNCEENSLRNTIFRNGRYPEANECIIDEMFLPYTSKRNGLKKLVISKGIYPSLLQVSFTCVKTQRNFIFAGCSGDDNTYDKYLKFYNQIQNILQKETILSKVIEDEVMLGECKKKVCYIQNI